MESFGGFLVLRTGEGCPGIQHASEWPNSLHSVVQFPVIATSGRERISVGRRERHGDKHQNNNHEKLEKGFCEQKWCHLKHAMEPTPLLDVSAAVAKQSAAVAM